MRPVICMEKDYFAKNTLQKMQNPQVGVICFLSKMILWDASKEFYDCNNA